MQTIQPTSFARLQGGPTGTGAGTQSNPISYPRFVDMFLPVLLDHYDASLLTGEGALYEKVTCTAAIGAPLRLPTPPTGNSRRASPALKLIYVF